MKLDPLPQIQRKAETRVERPAREVLYVVTDAPWNADASGEKDDTLAIQKALAQAGKDGGGIVFFPGGDYIIRDQLVVPSGVELRGIYDVCRTTRLGGGKHFADLYWNQPKPQRYDPRPCRAARPLLQLSRSVSQCFEGISIPDPRPRSRSLYH